MFLYNSSMSLSLQGTVGPPSLFSAAASKAERLRQVTVQAEHCTMDDVLPEYLYFFSAVS